MMFKKIAAGLTAMLIICLCGCSNGQIDKTTITEESTTGVQIPLTFTGIAVRTNGYHEDAIYPAVTVINSKSGLEKYYSANRDRYFLEKRTPEPPDVGQGFLDAADKYDNAFFTNHVLVLILLEEGSGSIRHEVTKVDQNEMETDITIRRDVPYVQTEDMAEWHIFIELKSSEYNGSSINIKYITVKAGEPTQN